MNSEQEKKEMKQKPNQGQEPKEPATPTVATVATVAKATKATEGNADKLAVVRIRGLTGVRKPVQDTLEMLSLYKRNCCAVFDPAPSTLGMLKKAKDFITWGEISEETLKKLSEKQEGKKKFFRLNSPKKGYGRKGIKIPFSKGGALGYRGAGINDLILRML